MEGEVKVEVPVEQAPAVPSEGPSRKDSLLSDAKLSKQSKASTLSESAYGTGPETVTWQDVSDLVRPKHLTIGKEQA